MHEELSWVDAAPADLVIVDAMHPVKVGRVELILMRTADGVHALADLCPHAMVPIHGGECRDGIITCPFHDWRFSVRTGAPMGFTKGSLRRFECREIAGTVQVELPTWMVTPVRRL